MLPFALFAVRSPSWREFPNAFPPAFTPSAVICDRVRAIVLGGEHGELLRGDPRLFERQSVGFEVTARGVSRLGSAGSGDLTAASRTPSGILYATLREVMVDLNAAVLVRSMDSGETWSHLASAPPELVGVAFDSDDSGYAWSRHRIYATRDGGRSWAGADAPGHLIPEPVVASDGALWVAVGHWDVQGNQVSQLIRFSRDLEQTRLPWRPRHRIRQMAAAKAGGSWLIADEREGGPLSLVEVSTNAEVRIRGSLAHALPNSLQIVDDRILLLLSDVERLGGRRLVVSDDEGASWEEVDLPESRPWRTCVASSGKIWVVGSAGAVYLSH